MDSLGPWIALAGAGVLHGLSPAAGCLFVARGGRAGPTGGWLPLLVPFAAAQAAVALWPWILGTVRAAGWGPLSPLADVCGSGSTDAAARAAWLPIAATGVHVAGMLAGTAVAASLARPAPGFGDASPILPGCLPSRSSPPAPSMRPRSMRRARPLSPTT